MLAEQGGCLAPDWLDACIIPACCRDVHQASASAPPASLCWPATHAGAAVGPPTVLALLVMLVLPLLFALLLLLLLLPALCLVLVLIFLLLLAAATAAALQVRAGHAGSATEASKRAACSAGCDIGRWSFQHAHIGILLRANTGCPQTPTMFLHSPEGQPCDSGTGSPLCHPPPLAVPPPPPGDAPNPSGQPSYPPSASWPLPGPWQTLPASH